MEEIIKAHCIDQEYWLIHRTRCHCGGTLQRTIQYVAPRPGGHVDVLETQCESCGAPRTFTFDIAEFYDTTHDALTVAHFLSEPEHQPLDERLQARILKGMAPPMAATLEFLKQLADAKDDLAFEYLEEAIQHFRQQASP